MSVRRILILNVVIIVVLLGALYGGYTYYYNTTNYVSTNNATVEGNEYPLNPEIAGTISDWAVKNGDSVSAGQVLGRVDPKVALQQAGAMASNPAVAQSISNAAQVTSPVNGTVLRVNANVGQMAAPTQPLGYVVDLSKLTVVANINESDIRHVEVGKSVDVSIDAFPNQSFKGTVQSIGLATNSMFALIPATDQTAGTYNKVSQTVPVTIALNGYSGANLLPGMSATVHIHRTSD